MSPTKILGGIAIAIAGSWSLVVHAVPVVPVAIAGKRAVGLSGNYENIYNLTLTDSGLAGFKATVRNIPLVDEYDGPGKCIVTGEQVDRRVVIAKAY